MSQEVVKFIRKSNKLVEARYKFDIWETRIFTKMLTMIRRDDEDFKDYKIYLKDIIHDFDLEKNKEAYVFLREGARKLMKKSFYIPYETEGVKRLFEAPVVSSLDSAVTDGTRINVDHLYLTVSFHPKMKPYLLQLKTQFTMYDVRNILKLPSAYSIRIYELLKQYEKIGHRTFVVQELKEILGIEDKYKMYGHFKKRVLEKAEKDLRSYTDIRFKFDEIKQGRAVYKLKFWIHKNEQFDTVNGNGQKPTEEEPEINTELYDELWNEVKGYDVTESTLRGWMATYSSDLSHVKKCIGYVMKKKKEGKEMGTVGGYINSLLQKGPLFDPKEEKRKKEVIHRQKEKEATEKKEALESEKKMLYAELRRKENAIMEALFIEKPDLKEEIIESLKTNTFAHYDPTKTEAENFQSPIFSAAFHNAVKKKFASRFEALGRHYQPKIKGVSDALMVL